MNMHIKLMNTLVNWLIVYIVSCIIWIDWCKDARFS